MQSVRDMLHDSGAGRKALPAKAKREPAHTAARRRGCLAKLRPQGAQSVVLAFRFRSVSLASGAPTTRAAKTESVKHRAF